MDDVNYEELDPGIRRTVKLIRDHGFVTTDSGDGRSKGAFGEDYPHVYCNLGPGIWKQAVRDLLLGLRAAVTPSGLAKFDSGEATVQTTWSPLDEVTVLTVVGICDDDLKVSP